MRDAFKGKSRNYFSCLYSFVYTLIGLKKFVDPRQYCVPGLSNFENSPNTYLSEDGKRNLSLQFYAAFLKY